MRSTRYAQLEPGARLRCLDGENACPPEDVGDPHRYSEFLQALADPMYEEYANDMAWIGARFDPAYFDRDAANSALVASARAPARL